MNVIECFTREQLQQFLMGKLPTDLSDQISQHLDDCEICEDTIVGLDQTGDTLIELLAQPDSANLATPQQDLATGLDHDSSIVESHEPQIEDIPEFQHAVDLIRNQEFAAPVESIQTNQLPSSGIRIGDYELEEKIASGGMGSVFRARHLRLEKSVAIKILPERKMQDSAAIARFSREMKIVGQMDHPTMVSATDAGESDGTHYLVMELVDGLDLAKVVRLCGPLAIENTCEIIRRVALGLQYGHERGVIHRDVKPSNLMLTRDGNVKILDLGLATLGGLTGTVDELTTVGQLMGTLDYMAPEQCGNDNEVERRTDIYGLGATMYKLLTGSAPYSNATADTPLKKLKAMAIESPLPIRDRRVEIPEQLAAIVAGCIERDPAARFSSAQELATALEPFCQNHQLVDLLKRTDAVVQPAVDVNLSNPVARAEAGWESRSRASVAPKKPGSPPKPQRSGSRFSRWLTAAVLLGLVGLLTWNGVTIYLDTIAGELVIDSEVDNISVSVIQNEKPTKEIRIEHGPKSTKLRAGKYRIEINGESDGLIIKNDRFELKKGDKVVARISKRSATKNPISSAANVDSSTARQLPANPYPGVSNLSSSGRLKLELVDLNHAVEVAKLRIELARRQVDKTQASRDPEAIETARIDLQIAQEEYNRAAMKYDTAQELYEKQLATELDDAKAKVAELQNSVQQFEERLSNAIKLSEKGYVTKRQVKQLQYSLATAKTKLEVAVARLDSQLSDQNVQQRAASDKSSATSRKLPAESFREFAGGLLGRFDKNENTTWPTYKGNTLPKYVNSQIEELIHGRKGFSSYEDAVSLLARKSTKAQVTELIRAMIKKNMHEVSFDAQLGIVRSLIPLCTSPEATRIVFDRMIKLASQVAIENDDYRRLWELILVIRLLPENQLSEFESLLIDQANNGGDKEKYFAIGCLIARQFPNYYHGLLFSERLISLKPSSLEVSDDWLQVNVDATKSKSENLAILACRTLAINWPADNRILETFEQLLESEHASVQRAAIEVLTARKPAYPKLVSSILAAIKQDVASPVALAKALDHPDAFAAISEFLSDPMAGSRKVKADSDGQIGLGGGEFGGRVAKRRMGTGSGRSAGLGGGGAGLGSLEGNFGGENAEELLDWNSRIALIRVLGGHNFDAAMGIVSGGMSPGGPGGLGGGGADDDMKSTVWDSARSHLKLDDAKRFLPLLRQEVKQATDYNVLMATWESISAITGEPFPRLYDGRTLSHWLKVLKKDDLDEGQHRKCLRAIQKLADPIDVSVIQAIAKSFRGDPFDAPVGRNSAQSKIANSKVYEELMRIFNSSRPRVFVESLDHLDDQDAMFALFVLANLKTVSRSRERATFDSAISSKCRRYARGFVDSKDSKLRRRALYVASRFPDRNFPTGSDVEAKPIQEILTSASVPMELRLSFLASLRMYLSPSEVPTLRVLVKTDDPILVSTILTLASNRGMRQIDRFISEQLAENRDYLDQSHRPLTLDLWNGPIESKPSPEDSGITIFEKIVNILDVEPKQLAVYQPRITGKVTPDSPLFQEKSKAIENLVTRYRKSEGATKRKLERILKTLAPESIDAK